MYESCAAHEILIDSNREVENAGFSRATGLGLVFLPAAQLIRVVGQSFFVLNDGLIRRGGYQLLQQN